MVAKEYVSVMTQVDLKELNNDAHRTDEEVTAEVPKTSEQ